VRNFLAMIFWCLGWPVGYVLILFRGFFVQKNKYLIIPTAKIGDLVCQSPVFRELKKGNPQCHITVLLPETLSDLIRHDPHIDDILYYSNTSSRRERWNLIGRLRSEGFCCSIKLSMESWFDIACFYASIPQRISLTFPHSSGSRRFVTRVFNSQLVSYSRGDFSTRVYLNTLRCLNINAEDTSRHLYVSEEDKGFVAGLSKTSEFGFSVGVNVSCGRKFKKWDPCEMVRLVRGIVDQGQTVVYLLGTGQEREEAEGIVSQVGSEQVINTCGDFSIGQFVAFCQGLDILVSVDSGPIYIAEGVGTALVDIAGPVHIGEQPPHPSATQKILQLSLPCVPCSYVGFQPDECMTEDKDCLVRLTAEHVLDAVQEIRKAVQS